MTPDEALKKLDDWIRLCRSQGQKGRAAKLQSFRDVIAELQKQTEQLTPGELNDALREQMSDMKTWRDTGGATYTPPLDPDAQIAQPWRAYAKSLGVNTFQISREKAEDAILEILLKRSMAEPAVEGGDVEQPDG